MSHLTTHILDATAGVPATDVVVQLRAQGDEVVATGLTDADGRLALGPERLDAGTYTLRFAVAEYFARGGLTTFYPHVDIAFAVSDAQHYHVPLLLSPFGYSTYRGS